MEEEVEEEEVEEEYMEEGLEEEESIYRSTTQSEDGGSRLWQEEEVCTVQEGGSVYNRCQPVGEGITLLTYCCSSVLYSEQVKFPLHYKINIVRGTTDSEY